MVSQRRLFSFLTVLIFIGLFLVACERPLGGTDDGAGQTDQPTQTDVNAGGGTDGDSGTVTQDTGSEAAADDSTADDSTADTAADASADAPSEENDDAAVDDSAEAGGGAGDASSGTDTSNDGEQAAEEDASAETTDEAATDNTEEVQEETAVTITIPATHTVAAGENLFRIGLKYGISWVDIARENNLANPHILSIGQELKLPGASASAPNPAPTPSPQTETTYIVKPGDNLYRIGLAYGISWVQIAEANGLDSPNMIIVGSELKIPVNTPGPAPQFTHIVQPGETLFLISLQYGVTWPAIAEANDLASPYVIYVGQMLEIPGSK